jgi:hypothetical protein
VDNARIAAWSGVQCPFSLSAEVGYLLKVEPQLKDGATLGLDGCGPRSLRTPSRS